MRYNETYIKYQFDINNISILKDEFLSKVNDGEKIICARNILDSLNDDEITSLLKEEDDFNKDFKRLLNFKNLEKEDGNYHEGDIAYNYENNKTFTIIKHEVTNNDILNSILFDDEGNPYIYKDCEVFDDGRFFY